MKTVKKSPAHKIERLGQEPADERTRNREGADEDGKPMRIALIAVSSVNALITRNEEPGTGFASKADTDWFRQQLRNSDLVLLGGATYRAARELIRNNAASGTPRWVFSRRPQALAGERIPGRLEFMPLDRDRLIEAVERAGHTDIALVGGPALSSWFLEEGLVSDLYLTLEPVLFSSGTPLVTPRSNIALDLQSVTRLAEQTLLLHYRLKPGAT